MKIDQKLKHQAHERSRDVCAEYRGTLDATEGGATATATIGDTVTVVGSLFKEQEHCLDDAAAAGKAVRTLRSALRAVLQVIVNLARFTDLEESSANVMHLPKFMTDQRLLAIGGEILDKVTQNAKAFLAKGLSPTVLDDLPRQIQGLAAAKLAFADARRRYTVAGDAIGKAQRKADKATKVVDTILLHTPPVDPAAVRKFRIAKRIGPATAKAAASAPAPAPGQ